MNNNGNDPVVTGICLAAMAFVGFMGAAILLRLAGRASPEWLTVGYSLLALCAVTGGIAAVQSRASGRFAPFLAWLFLHSLLAFAVVALFTLGGGFSAWGFGFWLVTSVGWLPGFIWFYIMVRLLLSLFRRSNDLAKWRR